MYTHLHEAAGDRRRERRKQGQRHSRLRRQRRLCRASSCRTRVLTSRLRSSSSSTARRAATRQLTIGGRDYQRGPSLAADHHTAGRAERGDAAAAEAAAGCRAADYGTASMKGAIAVVDDTGCSIVDKQNAAVDRGAVGLLVVSAPAAGTGSPAGLFTPGYYQQAHRPGRRHRQRRQCGAAPHQRRR